MSYRANEFYRQAMQNLVDASMQDRLREWENRSWLPPNRFSWSPTSQGEEMTGEDHARLAEIARMIWNDGHDRWTCWGAIIITAKLINANEDEDAHSEQLRLLIELVHSYVEPLMGYGWDAKRRMSNLLALNLLARAELKIEAEVEPECL